MIRLGLMLAVALASGSQLSAQTAGTKLDPAAAAPDVDKTTQAEDVHFDNEHDSRLTVPVLLSGSGPYRFLVDTGADRTAVSSQLVAKLRLQSGASAALHSVSGVSTVSTVKVPHLELTRAPQTSIEAAVLDGANMGADGIVGVDVLRSQRVQFDFEKQTMTIVPSATPDFRAEPGTIVVAAWRKNGRLVVTDASANGQHVTVVVDTGSEVSVGNRALRDRLRGRGLANGFQSVELQSVTGDKIIGDYMIISKLDIGGISLDHLAVVFTEAHTFKQLKLDKTPALLLGMNAIRAFRKVSIDFANRKFRVVLPEHSALATELAAAGPP